MAQTGPGLSVLVFLGSLTYRTKVRPSNRFKPVSRADPQVTGVVAVERGDGIFAQAVLIPRIISEGGELGRLSVQPVDPAIVGCDPERTRVVFVKAAMLT